MTIVGLVVAKKISPIRPPNLRPTNSTTSDENVDPTFPRDFQLKMREMAKESEVSLLLKTFNILSKENVVKGLEKLI